MRHYCVCLLVIVYMVSGKVYKYTEANMAYTDGRAEPLFGAATPDDRLVIKNYVHISGEFMPRTDETVATFNLKAVERWEIK